MVGGIDLDLRRRAHRLGGRAEFGLGLGLLGIVVLRDRDQVMRIAAQHPVRAVRALAHQPAAMETTRRFHPRNRRRAPHCEGTAHAIALRADPARGIDGVLRIEPCGGGARIGLDRFRIELCAPQARLVPAAIAREIGEVGELLACDIAVIGIGDEHGIALARQSTRHLPLGFAQSGNVGPEQHERARPVRGMDEEPVHRPAGCGETDHAFGQPACLRRTIDIGIDRRASRHARRHRTAAEGPARDLAARPPRQILFIAHRSSLLAAPFAPILAGCSLMDKPAHRRQDRLHRATQMSPGRG